MENLTIVLMIVLVIDVVMRVVIANKSDKIAKKLIEATKENSRLSEEVIEVTNKVNRKIDAA